MGDMYIPYLDDDADARPVQACAVRSLFSCLLAFAC